MMLTINELAKRTGLSSYEIRRRVHSGLLPHMRVGSKQSKILIDENVFNMIIRDESLCNIKSTHKDISDSDSPDTVGYDRLRKID